MGEWASKRMGEWARKRVGEYASKWVLEWASKQLSTTKCERQTSRAKQANDQAIWIGERAVDQADDQADDQVGDQVDVSAQNDRNENEYGTPSKWFPVLCHFDIHWLAKPWSVTCFTYSSYSQHIVTQAIVPVKFENRILTEFRLLAVLVRVKAWVNEFFSQVQKTGRKTNRQEC